MSSTARFVATFFSDQVLEKLRQLQSVSRNGEAIPLLPAKVLAMKHDGSLRLKGTTTPLMQLLLKRRSVRKYGGTSATADQVRYVQSCIASFRERMGFTSPRIVILGRGAEFNSVVKSATAGILGKINPWLIFTKASHLILCGTVYPDTQGSTGRERAVAEAAMTMQVAVLAATEVDLATCWMAGIHHERIEQTYAMPDGAALIAISTLGTGPERQRVSWDTVAYHLVSKRRRPLEQLWMAERWQERS